MARRRRLDAPGAGELAQIEAGFAAKPVPDRMGLAAPIAQVAGEAARLSQPEGTGARVAQALDAADAGAWRVAQATGRVLQDLPLSAIVTEHLVRDRMEVLRADLDELKHSIRENGQRLPVEVVALEGGRFGLISGWRRVTVLQELQAEGGPLRQVTALVRPATEAAASYLAMVEENELHSPLTPYERGRIAVMAADQGAFPSPDAAVEGIFAAASKAKRSKIRSFALVHEELGDLLNFPTDLSEKNGLRLAQALRQGFGAQLRAALAVGQGVDPAGEWAQMEPALRQAEASEREPARGGRPKSAPFARGDGHREALANGISMERVIHEDGYSIRLRGRVVDAEMTNLVMDEIRRLLGPL